MFKYEHTKVIGFDATYVDRDHVVNNNLRREENGSQV